MKTYWEEVYDQLYAIGTLFADGEKSTKVWSQNDSPLTYEYQPSKWKLACRDLDTWQLAKAHGQLVLHRCVWGATYTSLLYSFLYKLKWNTTPGMQTQWLE